MATGEKLVLERPAAVTPSRRDRNRSTRRVALAAVVALVILALAAAMVVARTAEWREDDLAVLDLVGTQKDSVTTLLTELPESTEAASATAGIRNTHGELITATSRQSRVALQGELAAAYDELIASQGATDALAPAGAYLDALRRLGRVAAADAAAHSVLGRQLVLVVLLLGFSFAIGVLLLIAQRSTRPGSSASRRLGEAERDQLTGLARRSAAVARLAEAIETRSPTEGPVALILVTVDADMVGDGRALDRVIQETARRIKSVVRSTDLVARVSRRRFGIVLDRSPRVSDAGLVADKVIAALDRPMAIGTSQVRVRPSAGIALHPSDARTADELLRRAETALSVAVRHPGPIHRYHSTELTGDPGGDVHLAEEFRAALADRDQLWIAYQPKVRLPERTVTGFEALLRWDHPRLGAIPPMMFIPVAEESDLIIDLGEWLLDEVCRQMAEWLSRGAPLVPVSVNISTRQIRHGDLDKVVATALARHRLPSDLIEIELTESVLLDDDDRPLEHMNDLRRLGIKISVDDFGTGYSSLSYLKRFPIDTLKIDRSFVSELEDRAADAAISNAIIAIAHSLDLHVVAEGVETEAQLDILIDLGCDSAQGYLFSEPLPAEDIPGLWRSSVLS